MTLKLAGLQDQLARHRPAPATYSVPPRWFAGLPAGYVGPHDERRGIMLVDPYAFYAQALDGILARAELGVDYARPLAALRGEGDPGWLAGATVYGAFVRAATAYDHDGDGILAAPGGGPFTETGTFLKLMGYLPTLRRFGVDTLYLLPVTKVSDAFKKGEVGSPYSVKSFVALEPTYHDALLDGHSVDEEFAAFVEACHILGMRVMLDFIPRTAARDNDALLAHPEWFYWIDAAQADAYGPPPVAGLEFEQPSATNLPIVYAEPNVQALLKLFRPAPSETDPARWQRFVQDAGTAPDLLAAIAREFGVIVPPAFSDWLNDEQPPWSDITFWRLYLDHPREAQALLPDPPAQPPYILFDVAKASLFPGSRPTAPLWDFLEGVISQWQETYGIDAARLDMGHALPKALEQRIIAAATARDPAFAFLAEELSMKNDVKSARSGYHAFLGNTWQVEHLGPEGDLWGLTTYWAPKLVLPVLAASEIADSPRAVARRAGKAGSDALAILNAFLVNGIDYIDAGQEFYEAQPMNLGLDHPPGSRFSLDPGDPYYARLAFFDRTGLHWNHREDQFDLLTRLAELRAAYRAILRRDHCHVLELLHPTVSGYFYWDGPHDKGLLVLINSDPARPYAGTIDLGYYTWRVEHRLTREFRVGKPGAEEVEITDGHLTFDLNASEATVYTVR